MSEDVKTVTGQERLNSARMQDAVPLISPVEPVMERGKYQPFSIALKYERILQAFKKYGNHTGNCATQYNIYATCTCGYDKIHDEIFPLPDIPRESHGFVVPK